MLPLSPVRRVLVFAFVLGTLGAAYADGSDAGAPRAIVHDPPPLTDKVQWVFDLRWDKGDVYLVAVRKVELATPMTTPRAVGRFALELSEKGVLFERARFDFPGLAVPDEDGGIRMTARLRTRIGVFFPATTRGDKLELVDRTNNQRWALPWPPQPSSADGGTHVDGG
jgi:hypothetical protein